MQLCKESLLHHPEHEIALCSLARLYILTDDLDQAQYTCMTLIITDKDNLEANIMLADLAFRKNDYESTMFYFQGLLEKNQTMG